MEVKLQYLYKHHSFLKEIFKRYASLPAKTKDDSKKEKKKCPKKQECKKEKKTSWLGFLAKKETKGALVVPECCKAKKKECESPEPDLSEFGGTAFKSCGKAYIVQKDITSRHICEVSKESKLLTIIEAGLQNKSNATDPMPPFTTVEQRMMDLDERRLHPLYKVFKEVPKRCRLGLPQRPTYTTRSGPVNSSEIPLQFKYNRELLDKKNMFADYKRVEPPRQLVAKIVEMKQNERPGLRKKMPVIPRDAQIPISQKKSVFDTLYQDDTKF